MSDVDTELEEEVAAPNGTEAHHFPCPSCGSDLRYLPSTRRLVCDHCGAEQAIEDDGPWSGAAIRELDFERALADRLPEAEIEETRVLQCVSCGAQVEFEPNVHAAECPFCATPVVSDTGTHRHIKPKGVLPFILQEGEAREKMTAWLGRLWFAPSGLRDYARAGRAMQGIYVPYWTFDADTTTDYAGKRGTVYYVKQRVRVMVDGKAKSQIRSVPKIRWRAVRGRVSRFFDDVLVLASTSLPKAYTDALAPWDLSALEPYRPEYLAGFRAEGYTVELEQGYDEARMIMNKMIVRDVKFDIGGDRQQIDQLSTEVRNITFKHVLLPVWLAAYRYRGKSYRFVVNARTGTVQGERPYSAWKIAVAVLLGLLLAGAVGYALALSEGVAF
ncbi:MAG: primosomal protein N' (replication factor Y) - superfamily II helicase [Pseudomonadota bacterium]